MVLCPEWFRFMSNRTTALHFMQSWLYNRRQRCGAGDRDYNVVTELLSRCWTAGRRLARPHESADDIFEDPQTLLLYQDFWYTKPRHVNSWWDYVPLHAHTRWSDVLRMDELGFEFVEAVEADNEDGVEQDDTNWNWQ
eukprot:s7193_g1.t1